MTKCVCCLYLLNLAQTLANAVVKVVIPTERYFRVNFILFFVKRKLQITKFVGSANLVGDLCGEKHWLSMCKLIDVSGDGPNGELERR